jgi:Reverse transcriptase (RNA-dependent DNA polymerase)
MEIAAKRNDLRTMFAKQKKLCNYENNKLIDIRPVKSLDGHTLIDGTDDIMKRWREHFSLLLNREIPLNGYLPTNVPLSDEQLELENEITIEEVEKAIKQMKNRKAAGIDGIQAEIYKYGGETIIKWLHRVILTSWNSEEIPEDWRKMVIIPLHKSNTRQDCNNARGISLLSIAGKIFTKVILNRISDTVESLLRENQCGFRTRRGCCDQIFTLRQIIEKTREYNNEVYVCFVDFKQAYDSIWRDGLWHVLGSYGIPPKIVRLIKALYKDTKACVRIEEHCTDWFEVASGLRQGCNFSTTGFNIGFDQIMRRIDEQHLGYGIKVDDMEKIADLEYADDAALLAVALTNLASLLDQLASESSKFGMKINIPKTKWMKISKNKEDLNEELVFQGEIIENVNDFKYLGSIISCDGDQNKDIDGRIDKAKTAFKGLYKGIWKRRDITMKTKFRVYRALIEPILLYGAESWTLTPKVKDKLDVFDNECLRTILGLTWEDKISNEELRERSKQEPMSQKAASRIIRWAGHVWRMDNNRIARRVDRWEPTGKKSKGQQKPRWKDVTIGEVRLRGARGRNIEEQAKDRSLWKNYHQLKGRIADNSGTRVN